MTLGPSLQGTARSLGYADTGDPNKIQDHIQPDLEPAPHAHRSAGSGLRISNPEIKNAPAYTKQDPSIRRGQIVKEFATQIPTNSSPIADGQSTTLPTPFIEVDADLDAMVLTDPDTSQTQDLVLQNHGSSQWHQRAHEMFKRYSVDLGRHTWEPPPKPQVERINKAPRMRVRWSCHECRKSFGPERVCLGCAHERCKKCLRYPPRRKKSRLLRETESSTEPAATAAELHRGACHECQMIFDIGAAECETCHHVICERCLEETIARAQEQISLSSPPATVALA